MNFSILVGCNKNVVRAYNPYMIANKEFMRKYTWFDKIACFTLVLFLKSIGMNKI